MVLRTAITLVKPKVLSLKNSIFKTGSWAQQALIILGTIIVLAWLPSAIFFSVRDTLKEFSSDLQPGGFLELIATTFASIFMIAACIHALQIFFVARENELFLLAPLTKAAFFGGRYLESCFAASWVLLILFLPMLYGYAAHVHAPWHFYVFSTLYFIFLILIESAIAIGFVVLLSRIYPARRLKELFIIMALIGVILLHFYSKSTSFVFPTIHDGNIEAFQETIRAWHKSIAARSGQFFSLPLITLQRGAFFETIALFCGLGALWGLSYAASLRIFSDFYELSNALERWQHVRKPQQTFWLQKPRSLFLSFFQKDLHLFLRDIAQPVQLILFVAIAGVTLISFRQSSLLKGALGGDALLFDDIIFTVGLLGHILLTVLFAGRFIFPALALEEESRWLIQGSPISGLDFINAKYCSQSVLTLIILLPLYVVIGFLSDLSLERITIGAVLSTISILGIDAIAIGSGSLLARLWSNNLGATTSTLGSFIYMMVSLLILPLCLVFSIGLASFYSLLVADSLSFNGIVCCIIYASIIRLVAGFFLRRASQMW
jgi:hypothetical protein